MWNPHSIPFLLVKSIPCLLFIENKHTQLLTAAQPKLLWCLPPSLPPAATGTSPVSSHPNPRPLGVPHLWISSQWQVLPHAFVRKGIRNDTEWDSVVYRYTMVYQWFIIMFPIPWHSHAICGGILTFRRTHEATSRTCGVASNSWQLRNCCGWEWPITQSTSMGMLAIGLQGAAASFFGT